MKQSLDFWTQINVNFKSQGILSFDSGKQKEVSMDWTQVVLAAARVLKEKSHPTRTTYSSYNLG